MKILPTPKDLSFYLKWIGLGIIAASIIATYVNAISFPIPYVMGLIFNNKGQRITNFNVCVENVNTVEKICEFTNENGEQIFNLANFQKGYSNKDIIKIIYCINTEICKENYKTLEVNTFSGGTILNIDISENSFEFTDNNINKSNKINISESKIDFTGKVIEGKISFLSQEIGTHIGNPSDSEYSVFLLILIMGVLCLFYKMVKLVS